MCTVSIWDLRKTGTAGYTAAGGRWGPRQPIAEPAETDFPTMDAIILQGNFICFSFSGDSAISVKREARITARSYRKENCRHAVVIFFSPVFEFFICELSSYRSEWKCLILRSDGTLHIDTLAKKSSHARK